ncbi:MAG: cell division topological specificity factor MinE [Candidatus Competibacteraceae bacterium]|nr:cell division topological specificity factor MinE [Candidatus Competibacteraceae bacterium]
MVTTTYHSNQSNTLSSAALARERLRSVVDQQRNLRRKNPGYLPALKTALLDVLCKHTDARADQVGVLVTRNDVFAVTLCMSVKCNKSLTSDPPAPEQPRRRFFSRFVPS